ncbi:MAG: DUF1178 family protein, partial [Rhodospirillaceae bacterium]|nr:DUF1178 family protein [Rhodospirillaceae bacterium]
SATYDSQRAAGDVACPACSDTEVAKAIMAPSIGAKGGSRGEEEMQRPDPAQMMEAMQQMQKSVEENCDYVGADFPEEARKIHYGESEQRNIYGESSFEEASKLNDEGIEVGCIPWRKKADS